MYNGIISILIVPHPLSARYLTQSFHVNNVKEKKRDINALRDSTLQGPVFALPVFAHQHKLKLATEKGDRLGKQQLKQIIPEGGKSPFVELDFKQYK